MYAFAVVLALYLGTVALMSTAWFHGYLLRRVTATLERTTGARVEIGKLDVQPSAFQATLAGVVLHGKESPLDLPLFRARTLVLGINPVSAFQHKVLLRRLDIEDAELHLYTYSDGSTNIPGPESHLVDDILNLSIGTLTVARTSLAWNDQHTSLELSARDVAVLLRYDPASRYQGHVAASLSRVEAGRYSLPPVTFATGLEFSRQEFLLTNLVWRIAPSTGIGAVSGQGSVGFQKLPELNVDFVLQAKGDLLRAAQILHVPELKAGTFEWSGQGSYRGRELGARGRFAARQMTIRSTAYQASRVDVSGDYTADQQRIALSRLTASLLGGTATGGGEVKLEGPPRVALRLALRGMDLQRSLNLLAAGRPIPAPLPMAGQVSGPLDASWRGNLADFKSRFDLSLTPAAAQPGSRAVSGFARGNAITTGAGLVVELEAAEFHTPHSSLTAKGSLGARESNLAITLTTSDFDEWRPLAESMFGVPPDLPVALKSSAVLSGSVAGPLDRPGLRGQLKVGAFEYRGWTWDELEGTLEASPDRIHVSSGKLLGGSSALTFEVSAGLTEWKFLPQSPLHITAAAERTSLEGLRDALNIHAPVSGLVTGRLNLEGSRSSLNGSGVVRIEHGIVEREAFDLFSSQVEVTGSLWKLDAIEVHKNGGRLTGHASLNPLQRSFSLDLHGANLSLQGLKELQTRWRDALPLAGLGTFGGSLDFDVEGDGTLQSPRWHSTFAVREFALNSAVLGNLHGQLDWREPQAQLKADLQGPGGVVHFEGTTRTHDNWPSELSVRYTDLRVDPWIDLFRAGKLGATVTLSGALDVTGPLKDSTQLEAHGQASSLEIGFAPDLVWKNDRPIDLVYAQGALKAAPFQLRGPETALTVEASLHLAQPAAISCSIQGQGDAKLLKLLDPALESTGGFDLTLRVAGSPLRPSLSGAVEVRNLSLGYGGLPFRLAGLNGDIRLEGDRFMVKSLRGSGGGGTVELTGSGTLYGTPKFDLQADLNQARVEFPTQITSLLTGTLHLTGTPQGGQVTGDLSVEQMSVNEDFNLLAWIGQLGGQAFGQGPGLASSLASKIRLDVGVTSSPEVRLESHELTAVATVDVNLQGTLANPVGFGSVHVQSGEAVIRGERYKLTRGDISMTNPFRTEAEVDFEAETRIEHYNLTLDVAGPVDRLRVSYRSDPPLPTADILSLLALGYSRQQQSLTATGTGSQTFGTLGASAILSQALSTQVSGRIQRLFGVSRIKIDPNVYGPGIGTGPRVTVEERLTPDFTVTYSTNTSGSQQRVIEIEYDLSDRVSLIGERDLNGVFGVEVRFRHRFR
ncbi:MAG TPA: translocation/assembly module TamB domain-containing protein [Terriglobia bacterium]|nr:translocation/assembly module TamB domain-containing protein [Terriglobia bacterium]